MAAFSYAALGEGGLLVAFSIYIQSYANWA